MKQKILLVIAALCLCSSVLAQDNLFSYNGLRYRILSDGTAEVENWYEGKNVTIPSVAIQDIVTWDKYDREYHTYKNHTVVGIGNRHLYPYNGAFCQSSIESVTIPNTVKYIVSSTFGVCKNLKSVTLPNSITRIESGVFRECESLNQKNIPNSVKEIGGDAFWKCSNLRTVNFGNSVETIGGGAFADCWALESVSLPNSLKEIRGGGFGAFGGCSNLKTVNFGNSVETIGYGAFAGCWALESVSLPNSLKRIEECAFSRAAITSVTIPNSVTYLGSGAFYSKTWLKSVTIPRSLIDGIDKSAFGSPCLEMVVSQIEHPGYCPLLIGNYPEEDGANATLIVPPYTTGRYATQGWRYRSIVEMNVAKQWYKTEELCKAIRNYCAEKGYAPVDIYFGSKPYGLLTKASQLSSNAKETGEGSFENLLDSSPRTHFHSTWKDGPKPDENHYLQIDLEKSVESLALLYLKRISEVDYNPKDVTVFAANDPNGTWENVGDYTLSYNYENGSVGRQTFRLGGKYRYVRISVRSSNAEKGTTNGHSFWQLGDLRVFEDELPEAAAAILTPILPKAQEELYTFESKVETYYELLEAYNSLRAFFGDETDSQWKSTRDLCKEIEDYNRKKGFDLSQINFTSPVTGLLRNASQLSSNAKETSTGAFEDLLDGSPRSCFHSTWKDGPKPDEDHYLQVDLGEEAQAVLLHYLKRESEVDHSPKDVTIYATNDTEGTWTKVGDYTLTYQDYINGRAGKQRVVFNNKYRHIRISVRSNMAGKGETNGHTFWHLADLRIYKDDLPETIATSLSSAFSKAQSELNNCNATADTYKELLKAYNKLCEYYGDLTTDIKAPTRTDSQDSKAIYDLHGYRVTRPRSNGIYIIGGKKIMK